jgi:ABC-type transporter Mla maintaining outer membrane lipid asymmetry ATPase subunit MlaF
MENIIEIKDLTKRYGDAIVLNDVTLSVGEGEAFGLLGPICSIHSILFFIISIRKSGQRSHNSVFQQID